MIAIEREAERICSVTTDNYMGGMQATSLLIRNQCDVLIHINVHVPENIPAMTVSVPLRKHVGNIMFLMN